MGTIHPMGTIGKLCPKQSVCLHPADVLPLCNNPVGVGKRNVYLQSITRRKVYRMTGSGACYISYTPNFRIDQLITGNGQEPCLRRGTLIQLLGIGFGEACRIAPWMLRYFPLAHLPRVYWTKINGKTNIHANRSLSSYGTQSVPLPCRKATTYTNAITINNPNNLLVVDWWAGALKTKSYGEYTEDINRSNAEATPEDSIEEIQEANAKSSSLLESLGGGGNVGRGRGNPLRYRGDSTSTLEPLGGSSLAGALESSGATSRADAILDVKNQIYENLAGYTEIARYPTTANRDFKEANNTDIIGGTLFPILVGFKRDTMRKLKLPREKAISAKDRSTGGVEEFVVTDDISTFEKKYILVIEAKRVSL
ncbi:hypothetical protein HOY82DRAFT_535667 [Tuber indicum]|nr:hypothetical protein HOY82DRAFT_535667 [Tuber indicum]